MPPIEPVNEKTLLRRMILDDPNSGAGAASGGSSTFITEAVLTDNVTIDRNADGEIQVKPGSIGESEIDPALVARTPQVYATDFLLATAGPWPTWSGYAAGQTRVALVVDDPDNTKNGLWLITIDSLLTPIGTRLSDPIMRGSMVVTDLSTSPYGQGYSQWVQVADGPITVGTSPQNWRRTNALTILLGQTTTGSVANTLYAGMTMFSTDGTGTFTPTIRTMGLEQYPGFDFTVNKSALAQIAMAPTAISGAATLLNSVTLARIVAAATYTITLPPITGAGAYPAFTDLTIKDETGLLSGFLTVTVAAAAGNSFEGPAATVPFNTAYQKATWYNDGVATWFSI